MTNFVEKHVPHVQRHALREQIRLSPLNLDLMAAVHRVLSAHTNTFERAVLDLSRRHERLQIEMRDQFRQIADIAERILDIPGEVCQGGQRKRSDEALDKRVEAAKQRQEQLLRRYDSIKSSVSKLGGRPLNEKEIAWISEVQALSDSVKNEEERGDGSDTLKQRFETVS
jgi:nucleoporin NUP82